MTNKQLEKWGIYEEELKLRPDLYWCNITQTNIILLEVETEEDVAEKIFREGVKQGIEGGKRRRSKQIKSLLNNEDL